MKVFCLFTVASGNLLYGMVNIFFATHTLEAKPYDNYPALFMVLIAMIIVNFFFSALTFFYQEEIMKSKLGKPIFATISLLYLGRVFEELVLFHGFPSSLPAWVFTIGYFVIGICSTILFFMCKTGTKAEKDDYLFLK